MGFSQLGSSGLTLGRLINYVFKSHFKISSTGSTKEAHCLHGSCGQNYLGL